MDGLHVVLAKYPADLIGGGMLVGKHDYSCGFFSLLLLFIFGVEGIVDIMVTVAIFSEGSLQML